MGTANRTHDLLVAFEIPPDLQPHDTASRTVTNEHSIRFPRLKPSPENHWTPGRLLNVARSLCRQRCPPTRHLLPPFVMLPLRTPSVPHCSRDGGTSSTGLPEPARPTATGRGSRAPSLSRKVPSQSTIKAQNHSPRGTTV